jgi:hypothetical protein
MNLEEMKKAWEILDKRLADQNRLALQTFTDSRIDKAKSALWPLALGLWTQVLFGVALAVPFAIFWIRHLESLHLAIAGIMVHAYGLMMVIDAGAQLAAIRQIDHSKPVLEIQSTLTKLRDRRVRLAPWLYGATGCVVWIPFLMVTFASLGADIWVKAPSVMNWFILCGALSLSTLFFLQWLVFRRPNSRLACLVAKMNSGASLDKAWKFLEQLEQFQKEEATDRI